MARKLKSDRVLFLAAALLVSAGVVMVYSTTAQSAIGEPGQVSRELMKQLMWVALGAAGMAIAMRVDYRAWRNPVLIWVLVGAAVAALLAVLFMPAVNGSHRWFRIGPIGGQPSEFAKLVVIIFTAAVLERRMDRIAEPLYALPPIALLLAVLAGLILLEPDFGTSVIVVLIAASIVFAAGLPARMVAAFGALIAALGTVALVIEPYRVRRLLAFLNPWEDPQKDGYQLIQSLYAVGSGGITGTGLMEGRQKLYYLPFAHTDFIYSVIGEELGLVGASLVLGCFCLIAWRGLRIAHKAPDRLGGLLAVGITTMIAAQALVNISVVLGLLPTKGIPLPFVSAGGSSLVAQMIALGILLNVSQQASAAN